jgi:hypothetical protein
VAKIGLIAPFEGEQRATGYEALYAVKLALREQNVRGGVAGWNLELVALDNGDHSQQALRQAQALVVDPDVVFVLAISPPSDHQALRAQFAKVAMPASVIDTTPTSALALPPDFIERYRAISGGITPGALASEAYAAMQQELAQLSLRIEATGKPSR